MDLGQNIRYGVQNVMFAEIKDGKPLKPIAFPGAVSASKEDEQSMTNVYADNTIFITTKGTKNTTGELKVIHMPEAFLEFIGYRKMPNGGYTDTGITKKVAIQWEETELNNETMEETTRLNILYSCLAAQPTKESTTKEDEISPVELTIELKASPADYAKDDLGKPVAYFTLLRTEANSILYDSFKENIILPTDVAQ